VETRLIADLQPDETLGPVQYTLTPEMVRYYTDALDDKNPWYLEDSPFGGPVCIPVFAYLEKLRLWQFENRVAGENATVHYIFDCDFINPAKVGEQITVKARVVNNYWKRGRHYISFVIESFGQDGRPITVYRDTTLLVWRKEEGK